MSADLGGQLGWVRDLLATGQTDGASDCHPSSGTFESVRELRQPTRVSTMRGMQKTDLGYAITMECLTTYECDSIVKALSLEPVARSRAGARHLMSSPIVAELANGSRLIELARVWLGRTAIPFRATLFENLAKQIG